MSALMPVANIPIAELHNTEIGPLPIDWCVELVENFATISTGCRNTQDRVDDGVYPFFVRSQTVERINTYSFDGEAILTAGDGVGTGKIFHYINGKCDIHQRVYRISDFRPDVSGYYFYLFFSTNFYARIMQMTAKSSVDSVRREMISRMLVALPPKQEQQAIAEALSNADELIEGLETLIAKKRAIKQGAMQELLYPKKNWIECHLGSTAQLKARIGWQGLTTAEYLDSGDYHLVTGTEFKDGFIDWDNCHYVDRHRYNQDKYIQLCENDVLVTKDGTIGKVAFVDALPRPATLNSGVFVIRPINGTFTPKFLYYTLMSQVFEDFLAKLSAGSTISHLYQKDFVNFSFFVPSTEEEQDEISSALLDMDQEIRDLETKLSKTLQIKQGMMKDLLMGRVRLV